MENLFYMGQTDQDNQLAIEILKDHERMFISTLKWTSLINCRFLFQKHLRINNIPTCQCKRIHNY